MKLPRYLLSIITLCLALAAQAQQNDSLLVPQKMDAAAAKAAARTITKHYTHWQTVTLSGKLHLEHLPISPSVKIYMEQGQRIVVSLRAPFVGEVGTAEIDNSQFCIVNKMNKTYCRESLAEFMADLPVTISDLQDIFLSRIFLPGSGTLSMDNYVEADFYKCTDPLGWLVVPLQQPLEYDVSCGFTTLLDGSTNDVMVTTLDGVSCATATYDYDGKKTRIDLTIRHKGKDRDFGFTISEVDFKGKKSLSPAKIDDSYRQVSLRKFFKQMM